jgi:hypothetical protein
MNSLFEYVQPFPRNTRTTTVIFYNNYGDFDLASCFDSPLLNCMRTAAFVGDILYMELYNDMFGYQWSDEHIVTNWASMNGYLDCLRYAHEKGCRLGPIANEYAAMVGNLDCLRYTLANECPCTRDDFKRYLALLGPSFSRKHYLER